MFLINLRNAMSHLLPVAITLAFILGFGTSYAQETKKPDSPNNTSSRDSQLASKSIPDLAELAWIGGHWKGTGMGGTFEETWNAPMAGSMMGMFKFVKDKKIEFYEFLTIVPENDSIILRLKHFDPALKGWESKNESVEFKFVSASKTELKFDGIEFKKLADNQMEIRVKMKQSNNSKELVL